MVDVHVLRQCSGLFEAEISGPAGGRGTDDHVIQHLDLQEPGAFGEPASQASVRFTWRRIATGMIMYDDKGIGRTDDCRLKNFPWVRERFVDSTFGDINRSDSTETDVNQNNPQHFRLKSLQ